VLASIQTYGGGAKTRKHFSAKTKPTDGIGSAVGPPALPSKGIVIVTTRHNRHWKIFIVCFAKGAARNRLWINGDGGWTAVPSSKI